MGNMKTFAESKIESAILEYLVWLNIGFFWKNTSGGFYDGTRFRKHVSPFAIKGTSDILGVIYGGRLVALEVKSKTGKSTPEQEAFIKKVRSLGAVGGVVRSPWETFLVLKEQNVTFLEPPPGPAT